MFKYLFITICTICSFIETANCSSAILSPNQRGENNVDFSKTFVGHFNNKIAVTFCLKNTNGKLSGFYYYNKVGIDIKLSGTVEKNVFVFYEFDFQNNKTAKITCVLNGNQLNGQWEQLSTKKTLPILLTKSNKTIPALPVGLLGTYKFSIPSGCKITLTINRLKGNFYYHMITTERNLKGKVTFSRSLDEKLNYINFHGIEWAESSGDVSEGPDDDDRKPKQPTPAIVEGLLDDNEIIIQNYGNAMNYYTKLGECTDEKYIHLRK